MNVAAAGQSAGLTADQLEQLRGLGAHQISIATALDVEPDQRLGVGCAEVETPGIELEAYPVGEVFALRRGRVARRAPLDGRRAVRTPPVDLAAGREPQDALAYELRQRPTALGHQLRDQQPRDHPAVAVGEVTEIMMCAHLAAVDTIHFQNALLDEGVPGLGLHSASAVSLNDFERVQDLPLIVGAVCAGM